jgi:hypothetical protein
MEEGHQKSKILSYMAKFKCKVIWWRQEKGICKAVAIFGIDESSVQFWWKQGSTQ